MLQPLTRAEISFPDLFLHRHSLIITQLNNLGEPTHLSQVFALCSSLLSDILSREFKLP